MLKGNGTIALVGAGEFLPGVKEMDAALLTTLKTPPHVVILPTAAAPDGLAVAERWARDGVTHFKSLGAEAEAVLLLTKQDAESQRVAERILAANFIYLSGGKPAYLVQTLKNTPAWEAIQTVFEQGGVVAGCSAGAMALVERLPNMWGFGAQEALGLVKGLSVIPHFDEIPGLLSGLSRFGAKDLTIAGIDGSTGLIGSGSDQSWHVSGTGGVTIFKSGVRQRFIHGQSVAFGS